jgi:hypothetical protein
MYSLYILYQHRDYKRNDDMTAMWLHFPLAISGRFVENSIKDEALCRIRDTRFQRRRFMSRSSGLWRRVVLRYDTSVSGEHGGSSVLRNVGILPQQYTASRPRRPRRGLCTEIWSYSRTNFWIIVFSTCCNQETRLYTHEGQDFWWRMPRVLCNLSDKFGSAVLRRLTWLKSKRLQRASVAKLWPSERCFISSVFLYRDVSVFM